MAHYILRTVGSWSWQVFVSTFGSLLASIGEVQVLLHSVPVPERVLLCSGVGNFFILWLDVLTLNFYLSHQLELLLIVPWLFASSCSLQRRVIRINTLRVARRGCILIVLEQCLHTLYGGAPFSESKLRRTVTQSALILDHSSVVIYGGGVLGFERQELILLSPLLLGIEELCFLDLFVEEF